MFGTTQGGDDPGARASGVGPCCNPPEVGADGRSLAVALLARKCRLRLVKWPLTYPL